MNTDRGSQFYVSGGEKNGRRDATRKPRNLFLVWYGWGFLEFYAFNKLLGLMGIREKE